VDNRVEHAIRDAHADKPTAIVAIEVVLRFA